MKEDNKGKREGVEAESGKREAVSGERVTSSQKKKELIFF